MTGPSDNAVQILSVIMAAAFAAHDHERHAVINPTDVPDDCLRDVARRVLVALDNERQRRGFDAADTSVEAWLGGARRLDA